ncbi:MAG: histidinol-phosphatase [Actinobacteria bacterium]|uniref:histidinol-phosphatase n=1 Tax=freshwater metagenome TaxID=449393 RepID=A0A6J5ZIK1_9ZZZZ|nr:histidinol-phosphatase [Actinomycetota bacterium]
MHPDLEFALELARHAQSITTAKFRTLDLAVETKPDRTPVSEADKACEVLLREHIGRERPNDGIIGEEFPATNPSAERQWMLDPIDSTRNYIRGVPVWGTLIALLDNGEPIVGVVDAPALGRRWWAARGEGAFTQDVDGTVRQLRVSRISSLADASFSFSDHLGWDAFGNGGGLQAIQHSVERVRGYGDFWSHMMVAEGVVDIAAEPELSPYDQAALIPVIIEAGGMVTAFDGSNPLTGGNSLTTNGLLHAQVQALIANN